MKQLIASIYCLEYDFKHFKLYDVFKGCLDVTETDQNKLEQKCREHCNIDTTKAFKVVFSLHGSGQSEKNLGEKIYPARED